MSSTVFGLATQIDRDRMKELASEVMRLLDFGRIRTLVPVDSSKKHWLLPFPRHIALKIEPQGFYVGWDANGVQIQTEKDFVANRGSVTRGKPREMTEEIAGRFKRNLLNPPKYDGVNSNCETVVSDILNGQAKSEQVAVVVLVAGIGLLFWFAARL